MTRALLSVGLGVALAVGAAFLLASPGDAPAQGVGILARVDCTTLTAPVAGQTFCFDQTANTLKAYTGAAWVNIAALATSPTNAILFSLATGTSTNTGFTFDPTTTLMNTPGTVIVNGQVRSDGGAVGAPAFTATGQTTTGLYFPALNQVALGTAGTQRLRWLNGNVLVGTATAAVNSANVNAVELHHSTAVHGFSAPGVLLMNNVDAASVDIGSTLDWHASGAQQAALTAQWRDGTTGNARLQIGLRTLAASAPVVMTMVRDGSVEGTAFTKFGPGTVAPANALEVENSAGPRFKMTRTGSAPAFAIDVDGTNVYLGSTGAAAPIIFRVNDVEKWRVDANGMFLSAGVAQASLGTPTNGTFVYCTDCTIANPCAGGGTGAFAKRLAGAWVCN